MIREIKELNFPTYATLDKATVTFNDMGEKTITSQVSIDGQVTPDFSFDWEVEFQGEKYIMPLRQPQASKENTSLSSKIDLTFQHWAIYQLKRWYFFTLQNVEAGVAVADKYIASVSLNLKEFCDLYGKLLAYHYGQSIIIDLNPEWEYAKEPVFIDINYSYMWDVLIKFYELFAVRWEIVPNGNSDNYIIKVGYPTQEMNHIFEYGFEGGLMKLERQVQDDNIRNMLLGRGGEKNIPYRYFKDEDSQNTSFPRDPDWVRELADVYMDRLRSAEFRSYVQGWKAKRLEEYPGYNPVGEENTVVPWAYRKGYTDKKFDPVEYVKDNESIQKYGKLLGGLENNDEIYPSIQGITIPGLGRIDEVVDVEQVRNDAINTEEQDEIDTWSEDLPDVGWKLELTAQTPEGSVHYPKMNVVSYSPKTIKVPKGYKANLSDLKLEYSMFYNFWAEPSPQTDWRWKYVSQDESIYLVLRSKDMTAINVLTNKEFPVVALPEGEYTIKYSFEFEVTNFNSHDLNYAADYLWNKLILHVRVKNRRIDYSALEEKKSKDETFDIWIKNIWQTTKRASESDEAYAKRVWEPILGNHLGDEAKVCFASGLLSTSEDYEFTILGKAISNGINYDTSKSLNGVQSHWRLTLVRSDADYDSLGKLVPNTQRQGKAGDYFFFTGIELTQYYVEWAERRLYNYKSDQLAKVSDIQPSWVVSLDKVRIGTPHYEETQSLLSQLRVGGSVRIADKRFIDASQELYLYLQQITYKYNESQNTANLTPNVEVVLGVEYEATANPVATIQSQIDAIHHQLGGNSMSNIQQIVRLVGDRIYLRKDGVIEHSQAYTHFDQNTYFENNVFITKFLATLGFRQGMVGGYGSAIYQDENGKWVIETDRLNVRDEMQVNTLVINQIQARGGMIIESLASIEVSSTVHAGDRYLCFFDTKNGSVANLFQVNDIAYCHRYTGENQDLKYYKRRVIEVGEDYIGLSMNRDVDGYGIPAEGDVIVQYGNYTDKKRQYVIIRDAMDGGYERMLSGLNSVTAIGDEYYFAGYQSSTGERFFIGNRKDDQYIEYINGKLYIPGQLILGSDTGNGKTMIDYIKENGGLSEEEVRELAEQEAKKKADQAEKEAKDYADVVAKAVGDELQSQLDGAIETWFYPHVPTLENEPAVDWETNEQKNIHLGDLFYDQNTGKCYRFQTYAGGTRYEWREITDTDISAAMAAANQAQDTADRKRRVFVEKPKGPYDEGDLWVNAEYHGGPEYINEILRCNTSRKTVGYFDIMDWEKASKYTDDSSLDKFKKSYNETISKIESQVDEKAETWYQAEDPSEDWLDDETKLLHEGDLWFDTSDGSTWIWGKIESDKWDWEPMIVPEAIFDKIDGKSAIYVNTPWGGYKENDLWFLNDVAAATIKFDKPYPAGTLLVATRDRGSFQASDWTKKDTYIDDNYFKAWQTEYYDEFKNKIESQLDNKAETWYTGLNPATQERPNGWKGEPDSEHIGDLWYCTRDIDDTYKKGTTWFFSSTGWKQQNVPQEVFDEIDGKASIYVDTPHSGYNANDLWFLGRVPAQTMTFYNGEKYEEGTLLVALQGRDNSFQATDWTKKDSYLDKADLDKWGQTYMNTVVDEIKKQTDGKAETWYQSSDPSTQWKDDATRIMHKGDLWYNTTNNTTWIWDGQAMWQEMNVPDEVFDKIDGKADIYVDYPGDNYHLNDLWFLSYSDADMELFPESLGYTEGTLLVCISEPNGGFSAQDWKKKDKYTDDTVADAAQKAADEAKARLDSWAEDGVISPTEKQELKNELARISSDYDYIRQSYAAYQLGTPTNFTSAYTAYKETLEMLSADEPEVIPIPDNFASQQERYYQQRTIALYAIEKVTMTSIAGLDYLKEALGQSTEMEGGLILTSLIQLGRRFYTGGQWFCYSGMNGIIGMDANNGYGIAAWYGGDMDDKEHPDPNVDTHRYAKTLFRFDGSGYMADGNITWTKDGKTVIHNNVEITEGVKIGDFYIKDGGLKSFESTDNTSPYIWFIDDTKSTHLRFGYLPIEDELANKSLAYIKNTKKHNKAPSMGGGLVANSLNQGLELGVSGAWNNVALKLDGGYIEGMAIKNTIVDKDYELTQSDYNVIIDNTDEITLKLPKMRIEDDGHVIRLRRLNFVEVNLQMQSCETLEEDGRVRNEVPILIYSHRNSATATNDYFYTGTSSIKLSYLGDVELVWVRDLVKNKSLNVYHGAWVAYPHFRSW